MLIGYGVSGRQDPQKCHFLYLLERPLQQSCTTVQTVIGLVVFIVRITVSATYLALWLLFTLCIICIVLFTWINELNDDDDDDDDVEFGYSENDLFCFCTLAFGLGIDYANTHMKNINKLVILSFNKILRILQNVSRDTHTVELYNGTKFNILPISCSLQVPGIKISPQIYSPSW